jgi:acetyltransferase-like isoleucine patch superfamily enzyme
MIDIVVIARNLYWSRIYAGYRRKYNIDPSFDFRKAINVFLGGDGAIRLGPNSCIGNNSLIRSEKGCKVIIGDNVAIADYFRVYTGQRKVDQASYMSDPEYTYGDVIIDSDCWICTGVVITPNVHIGQGSVVGANSVVTHDVEPYSLVGGVPARFIRKVIH